jgi:hypothetical protein
MSLLNLAWRFVATAACMVATPVVMADTFHPFAEQVHVNPDWQFFAPVDVDELIETSPRKRANTGWFATYDRTRLWVSRPEVEQSSANGDFTWGNRYDIGFMTDDRTGWLASFRSIGGPNVYERIYQERLNRVNLADIGQPLTDPVRPFIDENDPQFGTRAYILGDSLNVGGLTNFELNKTWRREPYRYGGIIEPMIGFKYSTFNDFALNQSYSISGQLLTDPLADPSFVVENLQSQETRIKNQMVGGQLGARYFNHYHRWTVSGELRTFAMANFQHRHYSFRQYSTQYDSIGLDSSVVFTRNDIGAFDEYTGNQEFVFGYEIRSEAAYKITRYLNVRGGIEVIQFFNGIWRGANPQLNEQPVLPGGPGPGGTVQAPNSPIYRQNQDVVLAGFTFGIELNR